VRNAVVIIRTDDGVAESESLLVLSMSHLQSSNYDYTEGASEADINQVVHGQSREVPDLQASASYREDSDGMVFDGPGHYVVPSSVTTMHHERPLSRRESGHMSVQSRQRRRSEDYLPRLSRSRRHSEDTQRSSLASEDAVDDEDGIDIATSRSGRHSRRRESRSSRSVFENVARLFRSSSESESPTGSHSRAPSAGTRRSNDSRTRSEGSDYALDDEESERWGYSSQEEDSGSEELLEEGADIVNSPSDVDFASAPPSPTGSLPFLSRDPVFGDTRIEMDNFSRTSSPPPPPGPPSRQRMHLADEDTSVRFLGQEIIMYRQQLWRLGSVVTIGALGLIGHWFPRVWLRWVAQEKAFRNTHHGFVLVEVTPFARSTT
jgi:cation-transporting P-type ATPase 13A2